jgi:hypothetical protein
VCRVEQQVILEIGLLNVFLVLFEALTGLIRHFVDQIIDQAGDVGGAS